ncbi:MAG: YjjG family noncanonical pyrimidine nucleotidase [Clostridiales bacterium]|nr:YjjG family noncanonical pyrimidine nucleotidase [Clostridiales bacterium]
MIKAILWDVDNTLLDFHAAESAAIKSLFREFGFGECSDEQVKRYAAINISYWEKLERNEITKPRVLVGRFEQFFAEEGIDPAFAPKFNELYQLRLGDTIVYRDDSINIVRALKGRVLQYVISNGTVVAQTKKLRLSGLGELMDGIFLSEEIGFEKPNIGFFVPVFKTVPAAPSEMLVVGDSLTSDIKGANNAGIPACWYNPHKKTAPEGYRIDYEISDLREIFGILGIEQ